MAALGLIPGEPVYADITTPVSRNVFPVIEATLYTGIAGIALGLADSPSGQEILDTNSANVHVIITVIWAAFLLFRLVLPVWGSRRRRLVVTDTRIIIREAGFNGAVADIDLEHVLEVTRHGSNLTLRVLGMRRPLTIEKVAKAKKLAATIEQLAAYNRAHAPYLP